MIVEQYHAKNQFLLGDEKKEHYIFQSYESTIAQCKNSVLSFGQDWDYSRTTKKYLYMFILNMIYYLNDTQRKALEGFETAKNKTKYLQNLIDKKIIKINYQFKSR